MAEHRLNGYAPRLLPLPQPAQNPSNATYRVLFHAWHKCVTRTQETARARNGRERSRIEAVFVPLFHEVRKHLERKLTASRRWGHGYCGFRQDLDAVFQLESALAIQEGESDPGCYARQVDGQATSRTNFILHELSVVFIGDGPLNVEDNIRRIGDLR